MPFDPRKPFTFENRPDTIEEYMDYLENRHLYPIEPLGEGWTEAVPEDDEALNAPWDERVAVTSQLERELIELTGDEELARKIVWLFIRHQHEHYDFRSKARPPASE